jgi:hypothetical protein
MINTVLKKIIISLTSVYKMSKVIFRKFYPIINKDAMQKPIYLTTINKYRITIIISSFSNIS